MPTLAAEDDTLTSLVRTGITAANGTTYWLDRVLGAGGMSVAFFALQSHGSSAVPVVLKVMRPSMVRHAAEAARLAVDKELTALRRLGERVPPTPFVVRLIDTGSLRVEQAGAHLDLPWLAVEYVHGGAEGATLAERVAFSVRNAGSAFDARRAVLAVRSVAAGLDAIHEVGVIHRDVSPGNVLACGFGEGEVFKLADFGIARPEGMRGTFGSIPVGTPGYAAPEQIVLDDSRVGPATDVFGFAAVVFHLLTGEDYFQVGSAIDGVVQAQQPMRRPIAEAPALCPELRARRATCDAVDALLARATHADAAQRPRTAGDFARALVPLLDVGTAATPATVRRLASIVARAPTLTSTWRWTVCHPPGGDRIVRSVAWEADGSCLVATDAGLAFWNGVHWSPAPVRDLTISNGIHFVRRVGPGAWVVGGEQATIAHYSPDGVGGVAQGADNSVTFTHASGDMDDVAVIVGTRPGEPPLLYALAARHWVKPASLTRAASVAAIARLDAERWLVAGRSRDGDGFVASYSPLMWEIHRFKAPPARAYLAAASLPEAGLAVVAGASGWVARIQGDAVEALHVPGDPDLAAVRIDPGGCIWASSLSNLWLFDRATSQWASAWRDPAWNAPFTSIFADVGRVVAMTPDGGVVEGRAA